MIKITICLVLLFLASAFKAMRDMIQFNPKRSLFPNWEWWTQKRKNRSWLFKYPLTIFADGWHFADGLQIICYAVVIGLLQNLYEWYAVTFLIYTVQGIVFNTIYELDYRT
jgi:hypothetical protein